MPHDEALALATGGGTSGGQASDAGVSAGTADTIPLTSGDPSITNDSAATSGTIASSGPTPVGGTSGVSKGAAAAGPEAPKAPIVIGEVGNFSGVVGASSAPSRDAFRAWVEMINAKGGINGHPIKLYVGDDGNDASRDVALARDFVENRKAIALVNVFPAAGGDSAIEAYARSKNIPVIGGATYNEIFNKSPVMFPQTTGFQNWYKAQAQTTADTGKKKVAVIYCTEGAVCEHNAKAYRGYAERLGLEIVYEGRVSLAQPDFTAECLNARGAGADVFYPVVDGNSINRLAQSCSRQGFKPLYVISAPVDPPVAELEGAIGLVPSFPWFLESGSPASQEFGQAMRQYASGSSRNSFTSFGWASGKLLEKAAANVSAQPTSQELFEGLWAMRGETLGGLAPPLTFLRGKPAPDANCGYLVKVAGGKSPAPNGLGLSGCGR